MANPVYVAATTATGTGGTLSQGTMPTNAVGDMLLWVISTTNFEGNAASFSVPGDWTLVATIVDSTYASERLSVYSKISGGSETAPTVTISDGSASGRRTLAHMLSYRNAAAVDVSNTATQTTTTNSATSPAVNATVPNTLIVTAFRNWATATGTHSWASSTERTDAADSGGGGFLRASVADKAQAAAGPSATEVVTTSSNFDNRQFVVLALKGTAINPGQFFALL